MMATVGFFGKSVWLFGIIASQCQSYKVDYQRPLRPATIQPSAIPSIPLSSAVTAP